MCLPRFYLCVLGAMTLENCHTLQYIPVYLLSSIYSSQTYIALIPKLWQILHETSTKLSKNISLYQNAANQQGNDEMNVVKKDIFLTSQAANSDILYTYTSIYSI